MELIAPAHGLNIGLSCKVELCYFFCKKGRRKIIIIHDHAVPLGFKGSGIEDLVTSAAGCRKGDQEVRFP